MYLPVDLVAPGEGLTVEVIQRCVLDAHHEIVPHERHGPFHFALGLTPVWPAQYRLKPVESGEVLKLAGSGCYPPVSAAA